MSEYTVYDSATKKEITFDWNDPNPPTDADMEEVFAAAGQQTADTPPRKLFGEQGGSTLGISTQADRNLAQRAPGFLKDTAIDAAKGVVGLGESVVGVADLATGNLAGKGMAKVGYDPAKTKDILASGYSPERQEANANVQGAKGFMDTLGALVDNPSVAFGTIVESAPMSIGSAAAARAVAVRMLASAGIAPGTAAATEFFANPKVQRTLLAASVGAEGAMTAGSIQEQGRQGGRDYTDTVLPALAAGVGTATIGAVSSKIPGFKDAEVSAATAGLSGASGTGILSAGKEIAKSMFKEGVLEELPQSAQEQVWTNLAMGKPWDEGVGEASAMGMVAGIGQGGGMTAVAEGVGRTGAIRGRLDRMRGKTAVVVPDTGIADRTVSVDDAIAAANAEVSEGWNQGSRDTLLKNLGGEVDPVAEAITGARGSLDMADPSQALADPMLRQLETESFTGSPLQEYNLNDPAQTSDRVAASRRLILPGEPGRGTGSEIVGVEGYRSKDVIPNQPVLNDEQQSVQDTFLKGGPSLSREAIDDVILNQNDLNLAGEIAQGRQEAQALRQAAQLPAAEQVDLNGAGPSPVTKVDGPAQPLPAPGASSAHVQDLADAADKALDSAYGYGLSTPDSFGSAANLSSASHALALIEKGDTNIESLASAIHDGWSTTARTYPGQPVAKKAKRLELATTDYTVLPEEEKEKDRVSARAILQAYAEREGQAPKYGTAPASSPAAKIETTLSSVQQEFIRGKVRALGSIEAVQTKYGDQSAPVDQFAGKYAEQLFGSQPSSTLPAKQDDAPMTLAQVGTRLKESGFSDEVIKNVTDELRVYSEEDGEDEGEDAPVRTFTRQDVQDTLDLFDGRWEETLANAKKASEPQVVERETLELSRPDQPQSSSNSEQLPGTPAPKLATPPTARAAAAAKVTADSRKINRQTDDIAVAIAKLGGLDFAEAQREWGDVIKDSRKTLANHVLSKTRRFGAVFKKGGKSLDKMRESLVDHGYLPEGSDLHDFYEAIEVAAGGKPGVSAENQQESDLEREAREHEERAIAGMTEAEKQAHNELVDLLEQDDTIAAVDTSFDFGYNLEGTNESGNETQGAGDPGEIAAAVEAEGDRPGEADDEQAADRTDDAGGWRQGVAVAGSRAVPTIGGVQKQGGKRQSTGDLMDGFTPEPAGLFDATATQEKTAAPIPKIEDFGEKIGGARKDFAAKLQHAKTLDVATDPFSKTWPEPDYSKMIEQGFDPGHVALVRALRDEIPDKPRQKWKLKQWVSLVESLRDHAELALQGNSPSMYKTMENLKDSNSAVANIRGRTELYNAVGHGVSLRGVILKRNQWTFFKGEKDVTKWQVEQPQKATAFGNMPQELGIGDTKDEAIADFKSKLKDLQPGEPAGKKPTEFVVYSKRGLPGYFVGKKLGKNYADLQEFKTVIEARAYLKDHQADLEVQLAKLKDAPYERRDSNDPRIGENVRDGKDATPEMFQAAYGFRGVEFGNYVGASDRQNSLNEAFDALHDLAWVIGVPTKALSLNGELGLAFGARGHGGKRAAAAHYEPDKVVINLTKNSGAGSLAHEWFHAVDSYFSRQRGRGKDYITDHAVKYGAGDATRQELIDAFKKVNGALNDTNLRARSRNLDKTRTKDYWSTGIEMHARAFENYVIDKLSQQSRSNDFLANVKGASDYADDMLAGFAGGLDSDSLYPYLLPAEIEKVSAAFDGLFETMRTKETDKGVALFSIAKPQTETPAFKKWFGKSKVVDVEGEPLVVYHGTAYDIGQFSGYRGVAGHFTFSPKFADEFARAADDNLREADENWGETTDSGAAIYPVYLKVENPFDYENMEHVAAVAKEAGVAAEQLATGDFVVMENPEVRRAMQSLGYDGYYENEGTGAGTDPKNIAVFSPAQIKSATGNNGQFDPDNPDIRFDQGPQSTGADINDVKNVLTHFTANMDNVPSWQAVQSESELPEAVQYEINSLNASGAVCGVFTSGKIYIVADNLNSADEAESVFLHEAAGHYGLRGLLGDRFKPVLNQIAMVYGRKGLQDIADRYRLDLSKTEDRMTAAEEKLAEMAEAGDRVGIVKRAVAAVRDWLRTHGFKVDWSDNDIKALLARARGYVERSDSQATTLFDGNRFMTAWHGSPHDHDKFDSSKIGTGEGAQAYGYGLYFAGNREVAQYYKEVLAGKKFFTPEGVDVETLLDTPGSQKIIREARAYWNDKQNLTGFRSTLRAYQKRAEMWAAQGDNVESNTQYVKDAQTVLDATDGATMEDSGRLYQVELAPNEEDYLLWDKPLSEQSDKVRKAIDQQVEANYQRSSRTPAGEYVENSSDTDDGASFYQGLSSVLGSDHLASEYLHSLGIRGIKYLDGSSRSEGEGNHNYVIFNDEDVTITSKFALRSSSGDKTSSDISEGGTVPLQKSRQSRASATKGLSDIFYGPAFFDAVDYLTQNEPGFASRGDTSDAVDSDASPKKSSEQGTLGDSKFFSDILRGEAFLEQGFSGINVKSKRAVLDGMLRAGHDPQVLDAVIRLVPVDVVDYLARRQLTSKMLFQDPAMIEDELSSMAISDIAAVRDMPGAVIRAFAFATAAKYAGLTAGNAARVSNNGFATYGAQESRHILTSLINGSDNTRPNMQSKEDSGSRFSLNSDDSKPDIPEETKVQKGWRKLQDKYNRIRVLEEWLKEQGVRLSDLANASRGLYTMNGRVADQLSRFMDNEIAPLVAEAAKAKVKLEDIEGYLLMGHATEANEQMRKLHKDPTRTAFGVTDAEAATELAAYQARPDFAELKRLADKFQAFSGQTADLLENNGIISPEMRAAWDGAYKKYVPLRGGEDDNKKTGTGKGLRVNGKQQRRGGHERRDEHVIENIIKARESAIKTVEKNNVALSVAQLIHEAADDRIGTVGKPEKRRVFTSKTAYTVLFQGSPVASFTNQSDADTWTSRDRLKTGKPLSDYVLNISSDPTVSWMTSPMLGDHEINAYINGHQVRIQINDDIAAGALTNLGAEGLGTILSIGKQINNYFSRAYTAYDPRFTIRNTFRDFTAGMVNLTGDYGAATAAKIALNYPKAVREFFKGRHDPTQSVWVDRYRKEGGSTGASWLSSLERLGEDVEAIFQEQIGSIATYRSVFAAEKAKGRSSMAARAKALGRSGVAGFHKVPVMGHFLKIVSTMNAVSENAFRLATFMTLVQEGKTAGEAGEAAKNSTINFDKRGEWGPQIGALYLFFNPAIQGLNRSIFAMTQSKHKLQAQALIGSMALVGFLAAEMARNMGTGDDDEWDKVPRSVKNRNLVIRTGEKTQLTIPLPYEYGSFVGVGYAMNDMVHGKADHRTALNLASCIMDGLSVLGNPITDEGDVDLLAMMPTTMKLVTAAQTNTNSFGNPIAPDKYGQTKNDSQNMWRGTKGGVYDRAANLLNEATGGTKYSEGLVDISPEVLKYYVRSVLGGGATFIDQVIDAGIVAAHGITPDRGEIPMVNVLTRENSVRDTRRAFWDIASDAKQAIGEFNAARKGRDFETAADLKEKNGELIAVADMAATQAKLAKAKRDAVDAIRLDESLSFVEKREKTRELEEKESEIYDRLIKRFNQ